MYSDTNNIGIPEFLTLDISVGRWTLGAELWILDAGLWTLDSGRWTLDAGRCTLNAELCTKDSVADGPEQNQNPVFDSAWLNYWNFLSANL